MDYLKFKLSKSLGVSFADKPVTRSIAQSKVATEEAGESRRTNRTVRTRRSDDSAPVHKSDSWTSKTKGEAAGATPKQNQVLGAAAG